MVSYKLRTLYLKGMILNATKYSRMDQVKFVGDSL